MLKACLFSLGVTLTLASYGQAATFDLKYTENDGLGSSTGSGTVTIENSALVPNNSVFESAASFIDAFSVTFTGVPVLGTETFTLPNVVDAFLTTDGSGNISDLNFWSYDRIASGSDTCPTCSSPYIAGIGPLTLTLTDNSADITVQYGLSVSASSVPEPATWATLLVGFGALGLLMRRNRRSLPAS